MAKYDDISKITVTVTVNHTQRTISAKRTGDRCPLSYIQTVSAAALAGTYRDVAAYFLDLAADQEKGTAHTIKKQAETMLNEHRPIFWEELSNVSNINYNLPPNHDFAWLHEEK